jgi:hypothetical protein
MRIISERVAVKSNSQVELDGLRLTGLGERIVAIAGGRCLEPESD